MNIFLCLHMFLYGQNHIISYLLQHSSSTGSESVAISILSFTGISGVCDKCT